MAKDKQLTVLVVDEFLPGRRKIARICEEAGFSVNEAVNHVDALHRLAEVGVPDAFIIASSIDGDKGGAFVGALGKLRKTKERPALLILDRADIEAGKITHNKLIPILRGLFSSGELKHLVVGNVPPDEPAEAVTGNRILVPPAPDTDKTGPIAGEVFGVDMKETGAAEAEHSVEVAALGKAYGVLDDILRRVADGKLPGPMVPDMLSRVRALFSNPDVSFKEIGKFCIQYQALAARLVHIASSALYNSSGMRLVNVEAAIGRLGLRQTSSILQTLAAQEFIVGKDPALRKLILANLEASYGCALIAEELAKIQGDVLVQEVYTVGLFHNIGATFLYYTYALLQDQNEAGGLTLDAIKTIAGSRTGELNRLICTAMKLPIEVVAVTSSKQQGDDRLIATVHQAMWLIDRLLKNKNPSELKLDSQVESVGLKQLVLDKLRDKLPPILGALSSYTKTPAA